MDPLYIPDRFQRAVGLHVVKQLLRQDIGRIPLLLGIHGRPGNGKTYQCEQVLDTMGARSFLLSGGQLESATAGEPARLLRDLYLSAGRALEREECPAAAILINDADTALGDWGERVQYTVNRQTFYGELMHLTDYPTQVEGRKTPRVPIILTGNDFTRLYAPLVRAGRMTTFEWEPTPDERAEILKRLFPDLSGSERVLLMEHLDIAARQVLPPAALPLSVSFFTHLKSTLCDDLLWKTVSGTGLRETVELIHQGREPRLYSEISFNRLLQTGLQLIKTDLREQHSRHNLSDPEEQESRHDSAYNQFLQSGLHLLKSTPFNDYRKGVKDGRHLK